MASTKNMAALREFVEASDPKQVALVGLNALGVLAQLMGNTEFSAFLHDASKASEAEHVKFMADRPLSQREVNQHLRAGRVKQAVKVNDNTVRLLDHGDSSLGIIKTNAPFITATGEQK